MENIQETSSKTISWESCFYFDIKDIGGGKLRLKENSLEFRDKSKNQPFGIKDKIGYMFGDLGGSLFFMLVNTYLLIYFTDVLHMNAAVIGTLFFVANLWNATVDVLWGRFLDAQRQTTKGRFRPWILRLSLPLAVVGILIFVQFPGVSSEAHAIWSMVMYVLWGTLYSTVNIPYGSMASVITDHPIERTSLSVWRTMGSSLAAFVITVGGPLVLFINNEASGDRFLLTAVVLGIFSYLLLSLCVRLTKERVVIPEKKIGKSTT